MFTACFPGIRFHELRLDNFVAILVPGIMVGAGNLGNLVQFLPVFGISFRNQGHKLLE